MSKQYTKLLIVLMFVFFSCNTEEDILPINEMKPIMWDLLTADEWFNQTAITDSTARLKQKNTQLYNQIFEKYKITKKQFYNSYNYYQMHPTELKVLIDSVENYGSRIKNIQDSIALKKTIAK